MHKFLKSLMKRWSDWCGDRELELAIRRHLNANGYFGGSAKVSNVRLAAVQRPGWLQVYRFDVMVRMNPEAKLGLDELNEEPPDTEPEYAKLFGLVQEDVRKNLTVVRTFDSPTARVEQFNLWSHDLIQLRGAQAMS